MPLLLIEKAFSTLALSILREKVITMSLRMFTAAGSVMLFDDTTAGALLVSSMLAQVTFSDDWPCGLLFRVTVLVADV